MANLKHKKKAQRPALAQQKPALKFDDEAAKRFSKAVLVPIINEYMARLHSMILAASSQGVQTLFCYRAGLRIFLLYRTWLAARDSEVPSRVNVFKVSRIAALKGAYEAVPQLSLTGIGSHLSNHDLQEVVEAILGKKLSPNHGRLPSMPLHEFMASEHPASKQLREYLLDQSRLMKRYVHELAGDAKRILLIDSGWAGTTQLMLEQSLPEYAFEGGYFGIIGRTEILGATPNRMHGLMFENGDFKFDATRPETVFVLHRHLIESLLEPNIKSITQLDDRDIRNVGSVPNDVEIGEPGGDWDRMFSIALEQLKEQATLMPAARMSSYREALAKLTEALTYPDREMVTVAAGKYRSADLGRAIGVEPIFPPINRFSGDTAELRIRDSLWPAGQAALEYVDPREMQRKILVSNSVSGPQNYFVSSIDHNERSVSDGKVAVITRTKNRPVLLKRAADSVAIQTYSNIEWVVVNDGGNLEEVQAVIEKSLIDPSKAFICHNPESLGMEAASNAGIRSSDSDWIVIHDDDDSWHCDFLSETTNFLKKNQGLYSGVITGTTYITEEIHGEVVIERSRFPYQDWVKSVQLAEMATGNFFAPIAFLFERKIYDILGGFDAKLPVLGDWDFNLRFLMEADIGVIDKPLAYYHHRPAAVSGAYSNSVVGGIDKHLSYNAIVRNKYMREAALNPKMGALANLMSTAYLHVDSRSRFDSLHNISGNRAKSRDAANTEQLRSKLDERWIILCFLAEKLEEMSAGKVLKKDVLRLDYSGAVKILKSVNIPVPPDFDETIYLDLNEDVAVLVRKGMISSGFAHFIEYGRAEGRAGPRRD